MAAPSDAAVLLLIISMTMMMMIKVEGANPVVGTASWCVARSDASDQALQTALDYACGAGADCAPTQSSGLCFLPNTIQAHSSYAFNSYYQRKAMAPGSCDFAATATIAKTDPSYGSCVYPASLSTAGGATTPGTTPPTTPTINAPTTPSPIFDNGGAGGLSPGLNPGFGTPTTTTTDNSKASLEFPVTTILMAISFFLVLEPPLLVF